jgi:1-aminocyclopropane-1-carboxylate deaminase/D-cysteine desulfhydrase-like pyridoxal-dependent ACC family enzyme
VALETSSKATSKNLNKIISYGGTQSNAMLAIAAMCKQKNWEFIYYTKPISRSQKEQKIGNFYNALSLGMLHVELELELYRNFIATLRLNLDDKTVIVDQGGADSMALEGLNVLADEIREEALHVEALATPSGTGTTALYLALAMPEYKVYTTPSVGDEEYLKEQMSALHVIPDNLVILKPKKKYHFAKPYSEFFYMYKKIIRE